MKGYKIDFSTNTITMNFKFAAAASQYGTPEYKLIRDIKADFPTLKEIVKSGREQKKARPNKRLTYDNMKKHIVVYDNAAELMDTFEIVKALSLSAASPYKYVADWFVAQFPDYNKAPAFKDGKLIAIPVKAPEIKEYKIKKSA